MFIDLFGSNSGRVHVIHLKLEEKDSVSYVRPSLNFSFQSQDKTFSRENLTTKLNSENIESAFRNNSLNSQLNPFIRLELIDGCSGTKINSNLKNLEFKNFFKICLKF